MGNYYMLRELLIGKKLISESEHKEKVKAIMTPDFAEKLRELYHLMYCDVTDAIEWENAITQIFVLSDLEPPSEDFYKIVND